MKTNVLNFERRNTVKKPQNPNFHKGHSIRVSDRNGKWSYMVFDKYGRTICQSYNYIFFDQSDAREAAKQHLNEVLERNVVNR